MKKLGSHAWNVLVGGAGIAAAATCIRLCALGFRPLVLSVARELVPGIEAIPYAALPLFSELGMMSILKEAQAAAVEGFESHWRTNERVVRQGRWIHVDRSRLAKAAMLEASRLGTTVQNCRRLPELMHEPGSITVFHEGACLRFDAAVDATGRSAVWSRPVRPHGRQIADLYAFPPDRSVRTCVVRLGNSWAYRIGLRDSTSVAIISPDGKHRGKPDLSSRRSLGLTATGEQYVGRRPAFPQWAENPIQGRRLAVGDAALAYDPIAGQGIRFALSSAIAAVAVLNTLKNSPNEGAAAERFYESLIRQSRQRHLQFVRQQWQAEPPSPEPALLPEVVVFSRRTTPAELQFGSRIVTGEAFQLDDGGSVRWVGGVDLLKIRDLAREPILSSELTQRLLSKELGVRQASTLLSWCFRQGLITSGSTAGPSELVPGVRPSRSNAIESKGDTLRNDLSKKERAQLLPGGKWTRPE